MKHVFRTMVAALLIGAFATGLPACGGDAAETGDEQDATASAGKFETFVGSDGQHYFQLVAGNGERVLRSEGYTSLSAAKKGIASVKKNGADKKRFSVLEAQNGESYFNLVAANGEIIGTSETYASKSNATRAVDTVVGLLTKAATGAATTGSAKFDTFKGQDAQFYFRLRAKNGEIVLQSEGYTTKANAEKGIAAVKKAGVEPGMYEIVEAQNGQHYFRVVASNSEIVGRGEMYVSKSNAERGARAVRSLLRDVSKQPASDEQVRVEIEQAADGAIYVSESDYPFDFVSAASSGKTAITEKLVREKLASFVDDNEDADKPMAELFAMEGSLEEWKADFSNCEEDSFPGPAECTEIQEMLEALELNLTGIEIFYFGANGEPGSVDGVAVTIFIVGRTPSGSLAGVRTLAIWT